MDPEFQDPQNVYAKDPSIKEPYAVAPPPRKGHGCFFWGCIISIILAVVCVIAIGVIAWLSYTWLINTAKEYTETTPVKLPVVEKPEAEMKSLHDRVDAFKKAVKEGEQTEPLVLTADDLNALIEENAQMKGHVYVTLDGTKATGEVSIPMDTLKIKPLAGRYLNGKATFRVSLQDGFLNVGADEIIVKGKPIPDQFMQGIRGQNLAEDALKDPENREAMSKLESIEIKDSKVIIKGRAKPKGEAKDAETKDEAVKEPGKGEDTKEPVKAEDTKEKPKDDEPKEKPAEPAKDEPKAPAAPGAPEETPKAPPELYEAGTVDGTWILVPHASLT